MHFLRCPHASSKKTTKSGKKAASVKPARYSGDLRVIHGKGTGAVRSRVHELLKLDRRVSRYALAPANQGGSGATIAEFRR